MKTTRLFPVLILAGLVGCNDHQDHAARQQATGKVEMSMKSTNARIVALKAKTTDCNIERINHIDFEPSTPTIKAGQAAVVDGWLIDVAHKTVPGDVLLRVESEAGDKAWEQPVTAWGDRGDIVSSRGGVTEYQKSGFTTQLVLGALVPGAYNIYLVYGPAGEQVACGVGRRFYVK